VTYTRELFDQWVPTWTGASLSAVCQQTSTKPKTSQCRNQRPEGKNPGVEDLTISLENLDEPGVVSLASKLPTSTSAVTELTTSAVAASESLSDDEGYVDRPSGHEAVDRLAALPGNTGQRIVCDDQAGADGYFTVKRSRWYRPVPTILHSAVSVELYCCADCGSTVFDFQVLVFSNFVGYSLFVSMKFVSWTEFHLVYNNTTKTKFNDETPEYLEKILRHCIVTVYHTYYGHSLHTWQDAGITAYLGTT